jgi:hypothetical protein
MKHDPFIEWVQSRLTSHGFSPGPVDGYDGRLTRAALKAFQRSRSLPQSGTGDKATVEALRQTSAGAKPRPDGAAVSQSGTYAGAWPTQAAVPAFYGPVGSGQKLFELPYPMVLAWDRRRVVTRISLHHKVGPSAQRVLTRVAQMYSKQEMSDLGLNIFGGSYNVRKMRGGNSWSMHSWGIAIDFDPERNTMHQRAPSARLSHDDALPFWRAWEAEGWLSLGRARNFDWQHVQAARLA